MNDTNLIGIEVIIAGINRFYSEGYSDWSKANFKKLLSEAPAIIEEDLVKILIQKGFVEYVGEDELFVRVLKEIETDVIARN